MRAGIFLGIILSFMAVQAQAQDYKFVSIEGLIEQEVGREIIPVIYEKLGLSVEITPLAGKRAEQEATTGRKDGEIMRIFSYGQNNPTTLRVPTPYYKLETMAFVKKDSGIKITSKDDLRQYKVAKVSGVKHTDNLSKGLSGVKDAKSTASMMKMLNAGRVDVALTNTVDGLLVLKEIGVTSITPMDKPLAELDLYHYLHESHADMVAKVDAAIQEMVASGEMKSVVAGAEKKIIGN